MQRKLKYSGFLAITALAFLSFQKSNAQDKPVTINWDKVVKVSKTTPTLQLVYNPYIRSTSPIYKGTFDALNNLGASYVRYVPWFPYPKAAVVELDAPTKDKTSWDFTYADPPMEDLMNAQGGRSVVINFSTIPVWMWKTKARVAYPSEADGLTWDYNQGTELRDPSGKEVADYFARLLSWYTKGGFTDELGKFHKSNHHYTIPYWEVLNEPDLEHKVSPQLYTKLYDAIVTEMKKVSPQTKFVGLSLAHETEPEYFEYFLNQENHKPGVPLEGISYHFYGRPSTNDHVTDSYQFSFFDQANGFLDKVRYIESIRKRLAPQTFTQINEIGNILLDHDYKAPIEPRYWNLSGAMYAYIFLELTKLGIDVAGESQLVGYPTQFPDVSMMNWKNGKPNARYWVLKLLKDNFGPGDKLVSTSTGNQNIMGQAYITSTGKKLLLINRSEKDIELTLPAEAAGGKLHEVNVLTGDNPPASADVSGNTVTVRPFGVTVVNMK